MVWRYMLSIGEKSRIKIEGFSLIELSIVLIIMALLVVALINGIGLSNNAKILTLSRELTTYSNAAEQFAGTYETLPGLLPNASVKIKGAMDTTLTIEHTEFINPTNNPLDQNSLAFFQQLSAAGFLDDNKYDGGIGLSDVSRIGPHNYPFSKAFKGSFFYVRGDDINGSFNQANRLVLGNTRDKGISAKLLYMLDTKIDDGLPLTGFISIVPTPIDDTNVVE